MKIVTCHNFRHDTLPIFYAGVERLKKEFDVQVCCAVTKGDTYSAKFAEKQGAKVITAPNVPLGRKWNAALSLVEPYEGVLILGEDDLVSDELLYQLRSLLLLFGNKNEVIGIQSFVYTNSLTGECGKFSYPLHTPKMIGAGRMFVMPEMVEGKLIRPLKVGEKVTTGSIVLQGNGKDAEKLGLITKPKPFRKLWDDNLNNGLDRSSDATLLSLGYQYEPFDDGRVHLLDIKTKDNIWKWEDWSRKGKPCEFEEVEWFLSKKELDLIHKLRKK
jgi:hypothetical protein